MKCKATWCFVIAALLGLAAPASAQTQGSCVISGGTTLTVYGTSPSYNAVFEREEVYIKNLNSTQDGTACAAGTKTGSKFYPSGFPSRVCAAQASAVGHAQTAAISHFQSTPHYGYWYGRCRFGYEEPDFFGNHSGRFVIRGETQVVFYQAQPVAKYCDPLDPLYEKCISPIVIPIGTENSGVNVRFTPAQVPFDLDGDGDLETVAFPEAGSGAWLAIDLDGDGAITSGRELLGTHTGGQRFPSGFEALAAYAGQNIENPADAIMDNLLLWQDVNLDGVSQPDELQPAKNVLTTISLGYTTSGKRDQYGTEFRMKGAAAFVNRDDVRPVYDVFPAVK